MFIFDKLVLIFYVLALSNKKDFDHNRDLGKIIDSVITSLILVFFVTLCLVLMVLANVFQIGIQTNLKPYKWYLVFGFLIIAFSFGHYLKNRFRRLYPKGIDLNDFSEKQIERFKIIKYCIMGYIFIPILLLVYFVFFD